MIGDEVRKARIAAKMTQESLALEADVSRNHVSLIERNQTSPTVDMLIRLCRVMNASASELVKRVE